MAKCIPLVLSMLIVFEGLGTKNLHAAIIDVTSAPYRAVGNGTSDDTDPIQAAIDAAGKGDTVLLTGGTFLTSTIRLKSNMTLYVDSGATLQGKAGKEHYPELFPTSLTIKESKAVRYNIGKALIFSDGANNITIEGGGIIDGGGKTTVVGGNKPYRPVVMFNVVCKNLTIRNLNVNNSHFWHIVPADCDSVTIDNVHIDGNIHGNRDGIDIFDCHHVRITNCSFYCGDDAICLKSGSAKGVKDVYVGDCTVRYDRQYAIKFGTDSKTGFEDIVMENITIEKARCGIGLESVDGGDIKNVILRNITMKSVGSALFILAGAGMRDSPHPVSLPRRKGLGTVRGIQIRDVTAHCTDRIGNLITGTIRDGHTQYVHDLTLDNVDMSWPGRAPGSSNVPQYSGQYPEVNMFGPLPGHWYFRHVKNLEMITCDNTRRSSGTRPFIVKKDVTMKDPTATRGEHTPWHHLLKSVQSGDTYPGMLFDLLGRGDRTDNAATPEAGGLYLIRMEAQGGSGSSQRKSIVFTK